VELYEERGAEKRYLLHPDDRVSVVLYVFPVLPFLEKCHNLIQMENLSKKQLVGNTRKKYHKKLTIAKFCVY